MTTNAATTIRTPNCSPSNLMLSAPDGGAGAVEVEVVGNGVEVVSVGDGCGSLVGGTLALGSDVVTGSEGCGDSEGDGVTTNGPVPVIEGPIDDCHVTPTSTTPPGGT